MLPGLNLPASLLCLLGELRPCFTAPGFATFCGLVAGLAGRVRRRTVAGMLPGGCLQHAWPHDQAHYFFARARWELDEPGIAAARLAVLLVVPPGADLEVAVDDPVFRRSGRKVHGAGWQHDGSAPGLSKLSYGNCFVTAGIVVRLPFCARAVCLPVPARLHLPGKGKGPGNVEMAAALVRLFAVAFPGRMIHVVADAACHGPALRTLPGNVTWTCRIPRNAVLQDLAPPRTGRRGRPRTKGDRLGTADDIAATASWDTVTITAYGREQVRHVARVTCLWAGSWHTRAVRLILARDERTTSGYDLALVTTDLAAAPGALAARYATFPLRVRLTGPTRDEIPTRFADAAAWAQALTDAATRDGWQFLTRPVRLSGLGTQQMPVAAIVATAEDGLRLRGGDAAAAAARFANAVGEADKIGPAARALALARPHDVLVTARDWPLLLAVAEWVRQHPRPGIYPRQIPVTGMHTKLTERHAPLLT